MYTRASADPSKPKNARMKEHIIRMQSFLALHRRRIYRRSRFSGYRRGSHCTMEVLDTRTARTKRSPSRCATDSDLVHGCSETRATLRRLGGGFGVLPLDRLGDHAVADRLGADLDADDPAVDHRADL